MRVVGTAGHVDHGKSSLVRRLTGIDPDRLAEEKAREMTIDLGFAWVSLPSGETIGIVDVPGHRDFIENMLAGVGGIDAVLLVIAADEGVMPQTREHLAILDLLGVEHGLIVLNKIDLVDDWGWLELVEQEIREVVRHTALATADIVPVSARTGAGLDELLSRLGGLVERMGPRPDYGLPRLPIDRVFTISGFGTVVTGTLLGGTLRVGDEIEIQPNDLRGRVRGLQSYKQVVDSAEPGSRVAVNLSGVEKKAVQRGNVVGRPGSQHGTLLLDVRYRHLRDAARPVKHNMEMKFFSGAAEAVGRIRLLDAESLIPGAEGWAQIQLEEPVVLARGDRFILRFPSPSETAGGGVVVNPQPGKRWRRFQPQVIAQLQIESAGSPSERVASAARRLEPVSPSELGRLLGLSEQELVAAVEEGLRGGLLIQFADGSLMAADSYRGIVAGMIAALSAFHAAEPLRAGMPREELRMRSGLKPTTFNRILDGQSEIHARDSLVWLAGHSIHFTPDQERRIALLKSAFDRSPYAPPSFDQAAEVTGEQVLRALIEMGELVQVQPDVLFSAVVYREMVDAVLDIIDSRGSLAANELRDRFKTTRKYAIGLLEHLDTIGVTRRMGDVRVPGSRRPH